MKVLLRPVALAAIFLTIAGPAAAQEEEELQLLFGGGQKVSAASKGSEEEDARESAVQVTVISGDEIRAFGYRTLSEVLNGAPECFASGDRVYDVAGIRGFARDGDYNTRVLILLDGHVLNEPWNNYVPIGSDLPIDFEQVERVEIIAGPVSALYGSNAYFGAINIVTRKPARTETVVSYRAGSSNLNRATASFSNRRVVAWATGMTTVGEAITYPEIARTEQGTDWDHGGAAGLSILGERATFHATAFARRKGAVGGVFGSKFSDGRSFSQDAHAFADLAVRVVDAKSVKLRLRGYGDAYRFDDAYRYDPNPIFEDHATSLWSGGEAVAEWNAGPSALVVSLEDSYQRITQVAREVQGVNTVAPDPTSATNLRAIDIRRFNRARVTAQETLRLGAIGRVVAGLYVENDDVYGVQFAPRAGVVLHPWRDGTFKALYQRGFRSPSIYESFFSDADSQVINPDLKSETVDGFDLSLGQAIGKNLEISVAGFDAEYRNLILLEDVLAGSPPLRGSIYQQYRNSNGVRAAGATARADWRSKVVTLRADASAFSRHDDAGNAVEAAPEWLTHGVAILPMAGGKASLAARVIGIGPRLSRDGRTLGPVALGDVALRVNRVWKDLSMIASVTNLFDSHFGNPVGNEYDIRAIPQPGRRFFLEARWGYSPAP